MIRFPNIKVDVTALGAKGGGDDGNAAVQVFGRRFFSDQTPIEYLAELLLVFASGKDDTKTNAYAFPRYNEMPTQKLSYHPRYGLTLKLFAFLGASKLETRHPAHIHAFKDGVEMLGNRIDGKKAISRNDAVRLVQGVFSGFVGVAGDRTWTAHTFLPASNTLLLREVLWRHTGPKGAGKYPDLTWDEVIATNSDESYFNTSAHSYMARGGEVLYLQLTHLFNRHSKNEAKTLFPNSAYRHLADVGTIDSLRDGLQTRLEQVLRETDQSMSTLGAFVTQAFEDANVQGEGKTRKAELGWVPTATETEALLFAWEAHNICRAKRGGLQKISLLKDLCVLQVMRSLCFQSARVAGSGSTKDFQGNYAWLVSPPAEQGDDAVKKLAVNGYTEVENLLYRALRVYPTYAPGSDAEVPSKRDQWFHQGDAHVVRLFRKLGKQIGVIVPRKGQGMRITIPAHIVRLLVAALIPPGRRIRLDEFYARIFAHYGLAISQEMIGIALASSTTQQGTTAFGIDSSWFEEELRRGGYLIPLSDAVALVLNPYEGSV